MARDERQRDERQITRALKPPAEQGEGGRNTGAIPSDSPLSLSRLRAAFAQMLSAEPEAATPSPVANATSPGKRSEAAPKDPCEISPRSVLEAMLFVGQPDDRAITAREVAAAMRGVSPAEIEAAVLELNRGYASDGAPYEIIGSSHGYRLALRDDFQRMRDKFHGRLKESRLSAAAVEVLSIVAYNQPTTIEAINELRGAASGALLASLVRRKLVRMERGEERGESARYSTTERFLQHFRLDELSALPRSEELEKA